MTDSVIPRIGALREMNLEFFTIDMQGFITDHDTVLNDLYGTDGLKNSKNFNDTITTMATRIATAFASLKLAKLPYDNISVINNLKYLGCSDTKKTSRAGAFSLKFDNEKKKNAARTERHDGEETWALSRFFPLIEARDRDITVELSLPSTRISIAASFLSCVQNDASL